MQSMRYLLITALTVAGLLGAPAAQARPPMTEAQLVAFHDCHPLNRKPLPGRQVRGHLADNLATARRDVRYFPSHGPAYGGQWRRTHWCYR